MRGEARLTRLTAIFSGCLFFAATPALSQSLSHGISANQKPSQEDVEQFCASYGRLSGSQRKQYRAQYEEYCRDPVLQPETTVIQPGEPLAAPQQPRQQPQQPREPEPEEPGMAPEREPGTRPAGPEPAVPEPQPLRVDLVGELRLEGPVARQPGESQRFQVTVMNRGPDPIPGSDLWAQVFPSERDASRRRSSGGAFPLSAVQNGRRVRIAGAPGPGQERRVTTRVTLPPTLEEGEYWWCLRVDSRRAIQETDEGNNVTCAGQAVALGGERDSESGLSGLFGAKVDRVEKHTDAIGESVQGVENLTPGNPQPTGGGSPPPVLDRDLEIVSVESLGPPQLKDGQSRFRLGDAVLSADTYAVYRWPLIYRLTVRNNGREPARFSPYYTLNDAEAARIGVIEGFGRTDGDAASGTRIDPGETKNVRMFVDLRPESLTVDQILSLERGGAELDIRLFLGAVDAGGDSFDARVYRDALMDNHVKMEHVTVVLPVLHRVVLRPSVFQVSTHYDPDGIGRLRYIRLAFGDSRAARWIRSGCGPGERGAPNARVIGGSSPGWESDALLVTDGSRIEVDFDRSCGAPASVVGTVDDELLAWAPLGSELPVTITVKDAVEGSDRVTTGSNTQVLRLRTRPVAPRDCRELPGSSEYYYEPSSHNRRLSTTSINLFLRGRSLCVDRSESGVKEAVIEPVDGDAA